MKIHEYQAKEILRKYGVITPKGIPCFSVDETVDAANRLGGKVWVVRRGGFIAITSAPTPIRN